MLEKKIKKYKKKYYLNRLLKGSIFTSATVLILFYTINAIEYVGEFNSIARAVLFYTFLATSGMAIYRWLIAPLSHLFINNQMTDQEAASQIGTHFPNIKDKLLNLLQLKLLSQSSDLAKAGINQKSFSFKDIKFSSAVKYEKNRKYLKYILTPLFFIIITLAVSPEFFIESTPRIINYHEAKKAPFEFIIQNKNLQAFKNEDFTLVVSTNGIATPKDIHIIASNGRKMKMKRKRISNQDFSFTFKNVLKDINFKLEASSFSSKDFKIKVFSRPTLIGFSSYLNYPKYINKKAERLDNAGNFIIPEGTKINWQFRTKNTKNLNLKFKSKNSKDQAFINKNNLFEYSKSIFKSDAYQIKMGNEFSENDDVIEYNINVISDQHPEITMRQYEDTVLYDNLIMGGNISDDYGITGLYLYERKIINDSFNKSQKFEKIKVNYNPNLINQSFFHRLDISKTNIKPGEKIEYYMEVWDNDGINGKKSTKTVIYTFKFPSKKEIKNKIDNESQKTENQIDKTFKKSKDFQKDIKDIKDKLKSKQKLDWQDKKKLKELIKKHDDLQKEIEKLKQLNKLFNQTESKFSKENESLKKKATQLQKLMDEILDYKTKELYNQLEELLNQNLINEDLQKLLDKINLKQENVEDELDRAIELFKKLKFEKKANEIINDLKELSNKQDKLSKETEDSKKKDLNKVQEKQKDLNKEFEEIKENMEELDKLNQETENPKNLEEHKKEKEEIDQQQKESLQELQNNKKKKASDSQKKSSEKMKKLAQKMEQMMQSLEMEQLNENYDDLRKILENLLTLSFDQEKLMLAFRKIKRIDPKFVRLGQEQLKLKDNSQIIEDSLISLAKRVFQIQSFVTREVKEMNKYMDESTDAIKRRIPSLASGKQQFAMTSINNLALLLNDILKQMHQQMSANMSGKQMSEKKQENSSLSQLQRQLNQQIQNLKKSGKSGKQLSKALAKLAAQQQAIRNALKKGMGKQIGNKGHKNNKEGGNYSKILKEMEKTETDLVNKKLTTQTLKRQKEILTRLLESEKAQKERELDDKRESKTAKQHLKKKQPADFSEYLKIKELQIELLKTIPTSLNPYYKKQINEYFKKLKN